MKKGMKKRREKKARGAKKRREARRKGARREEKARGAKKRREAEEKARGAKIRLSRLLDTSVGQLWSYFVISRA